MPQIPQLLFKADRPPSAFSLLLNLAKPQI
jgi:hypothetical protein